MNSKFGCFAFVLFIFFVGRSFADTFGSGANQFSIDFVTIGNPGNPADGTGNPFLAGKVEYAYRIGKYEISEDMVNKANAAGGLGITHDNWGTNKPATDITWFEAAKFVNWLNTNAGSVPAYKFDASGDFQLWTPNDLGYDSNNLFRNRLATYFLPSVHEWYKAAYYDPNAGVYYDYPTGSDRMPNGMDFAGDMTFDAVFRNGVLGGFNPYPYDITDVGVLSPYGTAGQGGNVWEWEETEFDLVNDSSSSFRGVRGGSWLYFSNSLLASSRIWPFVGSYEIGFRVAGVAIPEPTSLALFSIAAMMLGSSRFRTRQV